jgi:thiol:disulfide interchange protein DsbC
MFKTFVAWALAIVNLSAVVARADDNAVRQAVQKKLNPKNIEVVRKEPLSGLYEVVADGDVFYTDEKVTYLFGGELHDLRTPPGRNVTRETMGKLAAGVLAKSTDSAVKRVKGNGKRVIYTFEDPNCGYCKELQKELAKLNDVTVYTFLWAILSPDSVEKAKAIWCSKDRARAWEDTMLKGATPSGRRDCDTPLDRNAQLAQRFGLRGTPGVYLANGEQIGGYVPADKIEAALARK